MTADDQGLPRVLMLTNAVAPDQLGGLERYVRGLAAALVRLGVPVTVVAKRTDPAQPAAETFPDGVAVRRHTVPGKKQPTFAVRYPRSVDRGVAAVLRAEPTALVHGHFAVSTLPATLRTVPYVYTSHGAVHAELLDEHRDSYLLPRPVRRPTVAVLRSVERRVLRAAAPAVVLSESTRVDLARLAPAAAAAARLIPGGIDTALFSPGPAVRDPWAAAADPLLFTARRLTSSTGVGELVAAMPAVLARFPDARLAIAGDGGLRADIQRAVAALGLSASVRLLGRIGDADLVRWYRSADLTVVASQTREGFGLATAESLACGTPVLVTPVGANPEVVEGLHPLLVAPARSPAALAGGLGALLDRPDVLAAVRAVAPAHARARWGWEQVAAAHLRLYREIRAAHRRAPLSPGKV